MAAQYLAGVGVETHDSGNPLAHIAARFTAEAAPSDGADGVNTNRFDTVRTFVTYVGAVTAATLRLHIKNRATGKYGKGASVSLSPGGVAGAEVIDWPNVGRNEEIRFTLESVSPGTSGNTVAVDVAGVGE